MKKTFSVFDMFAIGIGPSSSHTVGPMRAANAFVTQLSQENLDNQTQIIIVELYGSLAFTGEGHGTDRAITLGLEGHTAENIDPDFITSRYEALKQNKSLYLNKKHTINFDPASIIHNYQKQLPTHSNAMKITAKDCNNNILLEKTYYSIGGGTIVEEGQDAPEDQLLSGAPYVFGSAKELLKLCNETKLTIAELMLENEKTWRSKTEIKEYLANIANIMLDSLQRGLTQEGELPGGLNLSRRAALLHKKLKTNQCSCSNADAICNVSAWAFAVAEENAAGNRIIVAPTCGSAGVIPAVLEYAKTTYKINNEQINDFLLTAAAIEILYKKQASISGAEMGCQGEIGVACSMAAAALTAVLGGSTNQIENAAEIGIEHHLGLTCDPVKGLVQAPCIERNVVAANQAISIAHLIMVEDRKNIVSLDQTIKAMHETGLDMSSKYKETSLGGLAVNVPQC